MSWKQSKVHHYSPVGEEDRILADKKPDIEELLLLGQRATVSHLQQGPVVSLQHPLSLIPAPVSAVTVPKDVLAKANTHLVKVEAPQPGPSSSSAPLDINSSQQELLSRLAMPPPPAPPRPVVQQQQQRSSAAEVESPSVSVSSTSLDGEDFPAVEAAASAATAAGQNRSDIGRKTFL